MATKFGLKADADFNITVDSSPEYARQCAEKSLNRLGVDYIDLYYIHRPNPEVPIEKTVEELKKLIA